MFKRPECDDGVSLLFGGTFLLNVPHLIGLHIVQIKNTFGISSSKVLVHRGDVEFEVNNLKQIKNIGNPFRVSSSKIREEVDALYKVKDGDVVEFLSP